jgi:hypothetical protein
MASPSLSVPSAIVAPGGKRQHIAHHARRVEITGDTSLGSLFQKADVGWAQKQSNSGRYLAAANDRTISFAEIENSFAAGLRARFFSVMMPMGWRVSAKSIGRARSDSR